MTPEEFRTAAHALVDWVADHRLRMESLPVRAQVKPGEIKSALPAEPPEGGETIEALLKDLEQIIVPGVTQVQHPMHFGWFPSNAALASVLGDIASGGLGSLGISWESSPALTEVEEVVCDWMRQLLGLSEQWQGTIVDTASTAALVAFLVARERASEFSKDHGGLQSVPAPLVVYTTDQAHSSVVKGALLAGFGEDNIRRIGTDSQSHAMRPDLLRKALADDRAEGRKPAALWPRWVPRGLPPWIRWRALCTSARNMIAGSTLMPPWPAPPCCCGSAAGCGTALKARTPFR